MGRRPKLQFARQTFKISWKDRTGKEPRTISYDIDGYVCGALGVYQEPDGPLKGKWRVWHFPSNMRISRFDRTTKKDAVAVCLQMLEAFEWDGETLGDVALFNGMTEQQFSDAVNDKMEGRT